MRLMATTTDSPDQVIAYYSKALTDGEWTLTFEDPNETNVPDRTLHYIEWSHGKLVFGLSVATDPTTKATDYETNLAESIQIIGSTR